MHQSIAVAGAFALVALIQAISSCEAAVSRIDALAQKLEDHFLNRNLDNEITLAQCLATFEEFAALRPDDHRMKDQPDPLLKARVFLNDFMHTHLRNFPRKLDILLENEEAAKEFIENLEVTYKRFRPIYNYELSIYDSPLADNIKIVTNHLDGNTDQPPTPEQMQAAVRELNHITDHGVAEINKKQDIYENQDEFESILRVWATPEVHSWTKKFLPRFYGTKKDKYFAGDAATVREFQHIYQNGVAEVIYNMRSDYLCPECRDDERQSWFGRFFSKKPN